MCHAAVWECAAALTSPFGFMCVNANMMLAGDGRPLRNALLRTMRALLVSSPDSGVWSEEVEGHTWPSASRYDNPFRFLKTFIFGLMCLTALWESHPKSDTSVKRIPEMGSSSRLKTRREELSASPRQVVQ